MLSKVLKTGQRRLGNVVILGANGGIGQPLSLLMKLSPNVKKLSLFDIHEQGVGTDLSHISSDAQVGSFHGPFQIEKALAQADLVICPAGVPRKPGMTRDDLFYTNAGIVAGLAEAVAEYAPSAWLNVISNPVNSMVPVAADIFKQCGVPAGKIFGVTTLDLVRAEAFVAGLNGSKASQQKVPVVGGHAGTTIVPLLSQADPPISLEEQEMLELTYRIQEAGTEVVKAKNGEGSATLSMAMAAARFAESCLAAQSGQEVEEYAYVESSFTVTESKFFSSKITLNQQGIKEIHGLGDTTPFEREMVEKAVPQLNAAIFRGESFAAQYFED